MFISKICIKMDDYIEFDEKPKILDDTSGYNETSEQFIEDSTDSFSSFTTDNIEENEFINTLKETYNLYLKYGTRSNKSVNYFHNYIKQQLMKIFVTPEYSVMLEYKVKSTNSSFEKTCDIVVLKHNIPYVIFPVKIIKSNYKQNKNNSWENLTGELQHLKWANENIHIIPINIFMNKTPYLNNQKTIDRFENITINDISIYNLLTTKQITYDIISYIMNVEHINTINEKFDKIPNIIGFDNNTPFRKMFNVVKNLL